MANDFIQFQTPIENYNDAVVALRKLSLHELNEEARYAGAFHSWYVKALQDVIAEKLETAQAVKP